MACCGSIRLRLRPLSELRGIREVIKTLQQCNDNGIVDIKSTDLYTKKIHETLDAPNNQVSYGALSKQDSSSECFYRESVVTTETDGVVVVRFRSDVVEFELSGTDVRQIDDHTIVAIYGNSSTELGHVIPVAGSPHTLSKALFALTGAFSMIYVSFLTNEIYILKDEMGFKSLLLGTDGDDVIISDVATSIQNSWYEIPPDFMVILNSEIKLLIRPETRLSRLCQQTKIAYSNATLSDVNRAIDQVADSIASAVKDLCLTRVQRDRITILFSGGLDSAVLVAMVAEHVKDIEFIELINVAFKPKVAPDRITALCTYEDLIIIYPHVNFKLVLVDVDTDEYKMLEPYLFSKIIPNNTHMDLNIAAALHYAVAFRGKVMRPEVIQNPEWQQLKRCVAILRSVNIRVNISMKEKSTAACGDLGYADEDSKNNEKTKTTTKKTGVANTDNDECELAEGLYELISGGDQDASYKPLVHDYVSNSKEVLIGSGADELFGGYGRHAVAHQTEDASYSTEVDKDLRRLWKRNLGRDDRVVNAQGIRALYPYLHDDVIGTLMKLNINSATVVDALNCPEWFKTLAVYQNIQYDTLRNCEFLDEDRNRNVAIYINKWILREIALRMGLKHCAHFKKRAIQFGTRSAKTFNTLRGMSNRVASDKGAAVIEHSAI
ncbi:putative asparagine synthetase domain-containing protein [Babesia sp. Xinjiang]|uniref:putative asparagine synthetase domain-containing protein n=1 Tax=Babesia sp. Xinjiang TaxID=462227 RepID=UPI000A25AE9F|nr:putative asparagine synthetase domain-containing protein [Babesia sp. Xinjiang]ORM39750.1 putative asparagine synthetase domain-containing protein [Babesia sp. Xinjiang]